MALFRHPDNFAFGNLPGSKRNPATAPGFLLPKETHRKECRMMKRMSAYLGLALAACLSCFSVSALAEPVAYVYRSAVMLAGLPSVGVKRLELTLAMWRTGSQSSGEGLSSNLRASSNHFVMATASPAPDGVGLTPC
ncbi:hypothetical protein [Pseudomonas sp. SMN5]|uniref:hypothetical protein n=1 Tax=Pseudomonas sp. SMN5 TaxID=3390198 RepID=UPI003F84EC51